MATNFNNSWQALFTPDETTKYFSGKYPKMQLEFNKYNNINAVWLAELSRLIYQKKPSVRYKALNSVNLQETRFFNNSNTQCNVVEAENFAVLVFRGSHEIQDWLSNLGTVLSKWPQGGMVHWGFKEALEKVWDEVANYLDTLQVPVFYTGHSLGAALATLAASRRPPSAIYTFGSPRVGDSYFTKSLVDVNMYRVVNHRDAITFIPPDGLFDFSHAGELHYITSDNKILVNPSKEFITKDRDGSAPKDIGDYRRWFDPPEHFSDHTPINYVARLERLL
ncbi:lipase family protein [Candidatus Halobeggiatoa sp. HSG11]|nr:lipase family protein [Candidatus Halobeggiatoa sp. HSG11]